jgi:predicted cupin superfamily sugar epimerase
MLTIHQRTNQRLNQNMPCKNNFNLNITVGRQISTLFYYGLNKITRFHRLKTKKYFWLSKRAATFLSIGCVTSS